MNTFEHFCAVCGASAGFDFGSDFMHGLRACMAHRDKVERQ